MYNVGDYIIYGNTGVCKVADITLMDLQETGKDKEYYILQPVYQECRISTPADNEYITMRPIVTKEKANKLIDQIPSMNVEAYYNENFRMLTEHYADIIKTYDCVNLIELTMSLYDKRKVSEATNKKFGATDDRFMKIAEDLLFGEFAVALEIEKSEVPGYIHKRIENK